MEILKSLAGRRFGLGEKGDAIAAEGGFISGRHGKQIEYEGPHRCVLFDDFVGDAITATLWGNPTKGADAATVDFAHLTGINGLLRGTTGANATSTMANNGIQLHSALQWKADSSALPRKLVMEARVKISAITNIAVFVGFTDQIAALEMPIHSAASANTLTSNATDAVGFMFDTSMTDDNIWLVGVKGDTDAVHQNSGLAFVADTFRTLRVEVDSNEAAVFFIDGNQVGTVMASALTKTVALTPCIAVFTRSAASATMTLDYIHVASDRV